MKKFVLIVVTLLLLGGGYYLWQRNSETPNINTTPTTANGNSKPDPSNATFIIEDEPITLSQGRNEHTLQGSAGVEETVLMDKLAYGDLNADGKNDTALLLARYGVGSGTFIYTSVYISGPVNYKGMNAVFVGDRVAPQSISINNGVVTVSYLDRKPDDPLSAEPTISETKQFVYRNGEFVER